jgi:hypothetical protein
LPIDRILDSDVFLVSYPRSGNTWLRNLIAEIIYGESGKNLGDIGKYIPDIHRHDIDKMELKHPRVIKSHFTYTEKYKRIIYIARDPRDIFLSYYRYLTQLEKYNSSLSSFIADICEGAIWPGTWRNHVSSWLYPNRNNSGEKNPDLLFIKYENMIKNQKKYVIEIAEFLGKELNNYEIRKIIFRTSKNKMKKKERAGGFEWLPKNLKFVNTASCGNWRTELSTLMVERINEKNKEEMTKLGYLTNSLQKESSPPN